MFRLARRPVWLLGIASMILGFIFQLTALRFGDLALVQPILAAELIFVFGYLAVAGSGQVKGRDWLAAAVMSAGIGVFLGVASPSGGRLHAPGSSWLVAGLVIVGVALVALAVAFGPGRRPGASGTRRAAVLGAATGISWGFMAAVIKELSSHLDDGIGALVTSWSLYLLIAAGAATMLLASHALAAGPLAASQPGFTILDPLSAGLLGVFLFGEHIRTGAGDLAGEALALAAVIAAAAVLSHSCHTAGENSDPSGLVKPTVSSAANSPSAAGGRHTAGAGRVLPGIGRTRPASTSSARVSCSRSRSSAAAAERITRSIPSSARVLPGGLRPPRAASGWPGRSRRPGRRGTAGARWDHRARPTAAGSCSRPCPGRR
jgi:drug/metabolite transporter (DMT)-like permease